MKVKTKYSGRRCAAMAVASM